jgi:ABC-2 type transport system ATP-binding protein
LRTTTAVAEFEDVVKEYRDKWPARRPLRAIDGVSLRVEPGEVVGLLGPNRAGKTTLVKLLLSLCRPTAGRVARLGRPAADRATLARVGYVHEHPSFPSYLTASGLLDDYGALAGVPRGDRRRRIPELLERLGLADRAREPIARFSKGMAQRLGVAQALINDPDLLVLDEPNEGLDLAGRHLVAGLLRDRARSGRSALLISHVASDAGGLCDRIAVLTTGRLAYLGPPSTLVTGPGRTLEQALTQLYEGAGS